MITTFRVAALAAALTLMTSFAQARTGGIVVCHDRGCSDWATPNKRTSEAPNRPIRKEMSAKQRSASLSATDAMLPSERMAAIASDLDGSYEIAPVNPARRGQIRTRALPEKPLPALGVLVAKHTEAELSGGPVSNPNADAISCPRGRYAGSTAIAGLHPVLKAKVQEITSSCKTHVVSTYCRGGATPNHGLGLAVDLKGDPACIKRHMAGWRGGMSTDYYDAPGTQHYHISYSGRHEWGLRFAHNGGRKLASTMAPYQVYADSRCHGTENMCSMLNNGPQNPKYKTKRQRQAAAAIQHHTLNSY